MKHMMLLISSALALPIPVNANAQLEKRLPGCALELQMQQKFASKLPIVFTCRVQNQSKTALHGAVIAGPPFIEGYKFRVQVQCENGKTPDATPSNQVGGMSF